MDTRDSILKARAVGLDLVEVDPHSKPPVCRIMDYGKWKYSQRKKEQKSKAHRHETELKELRIKTPKIGDHDLLIKINHAKEFLSRGDRVQFTLRFRGRELAHLDEGKKVFDQIKVALAEAAKVEQDWRYEGKRITMTLAPMGKKVPAAPAAAKPAGAVPKPAAAATAAPAPVVAPQATNPQGNPTT